MIKRLHEHYDFASAYIIDLDVTIEADDTRSDGFLNSGIAGVIVIIITLSIFCRGVRKMDLVKIYYQNLETNPTLI